MPAFEYFIFPTPLKRKKLVELLYEKKEKIQLSTYTVSYLVFCTIVVVLKNYMSIFLNKKYSFVSIQTSYILKIIIKKVI